MGVDLTAVGNSVEQVYEDGITKALALDVNKSSIMPDMLKLQASTSKGEAKISSVFKVTKSLTEAPLQAARS